MHARDTLCRSVAMSLVLVASGDDLLNSSYAPTVAPACAPGYGRLNKGCTLCAPGKYRGGNALTSMCEECPGGSVPSSGLCFLGTSVASRVDADGRVSHSSQVEQFDGSCYYFGLSSLYWTSAERQCNELSGHLVCLNGKTEAERIARESHKRGMKWFWTGMSERGNEKSFEWTNPNCCSDFRNWHQYSGLGTREPTSDSETVTFRCVRSSLDASLFDDNCRNQIEYVCEAPVSSGGTSCSQCRKGSYAPPGATECIPCDFGKYAARNGMEECTACPTMSPASLLAAFFGQQGSVQCGGKLGRAQYYAYVTTCCLTVIAPLFLWYYVYYMQCVAGPGMAARGLAAWPTNSSRMRRSIIQVSSLILPIGVIGGSLLANWLKPMRQSSEDWPYKGRLTPTDEIKGCDPANRNGDFICAIACLFLVACCVIASTPILDLRAAARILQSKVVISLLKRRFKRQFEKWTEELKVNGQAPPDDVKASFECTLCGSHRADALNMPCGHQFMCMECARAFRIEIGNICNSCRCPSDLHKVRLGAKSNKATALVRFDAPHSFCRNERKHPKKQGLNEVPQILRSDEPRSLVRFEPETFDTSYASVKDLRAAVAATKRMRRNARQHHLASICSGCAQSTPLIVNIPCGHAVMCAECTAEYRRTNGDLCSRCFTPSVIQAPILESACSCCFDTVEAEYLVNLGSCGHQICTACSVAYIRSALSNVAEEVVANGVRCPLGGSKYAEDVHQCSGFVTQDVVERLVTKKVHPEMADTVLPLKSEEYERLLRFMYEASLPLHVRFYCCWTDCSRLFRVDNRDELIRNGAAASNDTSMWTCFDSLRRGPHSFFTRVRERLRGTPQAWRPTEMSSSSALNENCNNFTGTVLEASGDFELTISDENEGNIDIETKDEEDSFRGDPPFVTCPYCSRDSCVRCGIIAHRTISCREYKMGGSAILESSALVEATSKECPQCKLRITHYHGHACHHISPGRGCPNCGTHFCYRCLKKGTSGNSCGCRPFCQNEDIVFHIERTPYPHDTRCGCPLCPDCMPGSPCVQCDGGCVVCRGNVPPGPRDMNGVATWPM